MDVVWEDPPKSSRGAANRGLKRSPWWDVLAKLDSKPGQWALVDADFTGTTHPIYGLVKARDLPYEIRVRVNENNARSVYVRRKETSEEKK